MTTPDVTLVMLNGYVDIDRGDSRYRSVLWPLTHRFEDAEGGGHSVLPFYLYDEEGDIKSFYSLLFNYQSDGTLLNVGGPLYYEVEKDDERSRWALWPLLRWWESDEERGNWALPLFYRQVKENGDQSIITLLGGYSKSDDGSWLNVLGPIFHDLARGREPVQDILVSADAPLRRRGQPKAHGLAALHP